MEAFNFLLNHWDTIGLVLSNIAALFINPPFRGKK